MLLADFFPNDKALAFLQEPLACLGQEQALTSRASHLCAHLFNAAKKLINVVFAIIVVFGLSIFQQFRREI
jgi:hypothetical protein